MSQGRVLKALAAGGYIVVDHISAPLSAAGRVYRLMPQNRTLVEAFVKRMESDRLIHPQADSLFPDGPPQTYVLFRTSEGGA